MHKKGANTKKNSYKNVFMINYFTCDFFQVEETSH